MRAATVVQVLQYLFKFYCMFYFTCDRSDIAGRLCSVTTGYNHPDQVYPTLICSLLQNTDEVEMFTSRPRLFMQRQTVQHNSCTMGSRTLRPQDTSASRHFVTTKLVQKCPDTLGPGPKCADSSAVTKALIDTSAPNLSQIWCRSVQIFSIWCRSVMRHFGTGAEVSRSGPKCLVAEVSGNRAMLTVMHMTLSTVIKREH